MRFWSRLACALLALNAAGCAIAASEAEVTVELGEARVEVLVLLKDVRLATDDRIEGLKVFTPFADLETARVAFARSPLAAWGGTLTAVAWRPRGQALDVEVRGLLPRGDFDTCAAAVCRSQLDSAHQRCMGFPVARCEDGHQARWTERELPLTGPARWPADARRLTAKLALVPRKQEDHARMHPALDVFLHHSQAPEATRASLQRMQRFQEAYRAEDLPRALSLQEEALAAKDSLALEEVQRERIRLLHRFLADHRAELLSPPPGLWEGFNAFALKSPEPEVSEPEVPMAEVPRLRLQVAYEAALRPLKAKGRLEVPDAQLANVCTEASVRRKAASRRLCDHLMLRGPRGWTFAPWATPPRKGP